MSSKVFFYVSAVFWALMAFSDLHTVIATPNLVNFILVTLSSALTAMSVYLARKEPSSV